MEIQILELQTIVAREKDPQDPRSSRWFDPWALMRSEDLFTRELACFHGITEHPRHPETLESAFDQAEGLVMDAIDQMRQSLSI